MKAVGLNGDRTQCAHPYLFNDPQKNKLHGFWHSTTANAVSRLLSVFPCDFCLVFSINKTRQSLDYRVDYREFSVDFDSFAISVIPFKVNRLSLNPLFIRLFCFGHFSNWIALMKIRIQRYLMLSFSLILIGSRDPIFKMKNRKWFRIRHSWPFITFKMFQTI